MLDTESPRRFSGNPIADLLAIAFVAFVFLSLAQVVLRAAPPNGNHACEDQQYQVYTALQEYLSDWDEHFPPMQNATVFSTALSTYAPYPQPLTTCPVTNTKYKPYAPLSGVSFYSIGGNPDQIEILRDAQPHPDHLLTVLFLDGHVEHGGQDPADKQLTCVQNTQQLVLAVQMYAQDYDEVLPTLSDAATAETLLLPYVGMTGPFTCPVTHLPYTYNASIGGHTLQTYPRTDQVEIVRDSQPHPGNQTTIAYLDGHVTRGGTLVYPNPDVYCAFRVKQIPLGILMYAQDYDDILPGGAGSWQNQLLPYIRNQDDFFCPVTANAYAFNDSLRGINIGTITNPSHTIAVQDAVKHPNGVVTSGFLDAHVEQNGQTVPGTIPLGSADDVALTRGKQLALGVMMYVQDYDEKFPPMNDYNRFRDILFPYIKNNDDFLVPPWNTPWILNQALGGLSLGDIPAPATTTLFQAPHPGRGGLIVRAFADGHVKRVIP
jgi:prepilin-type processing-associated H-X9-DG protein